MKKTLALLLVVLALVFLTAPIVIASTVVDPVQAPVVEIAAEEPVIEEGTPAPTETDPGGEPWFRVDLTVIFDWIIRVLVVPILLRLGAWAKTKVGERKFGLLLQAITLGVNAAEESFKAGRGAEKYNYVVEYLRRRGLSFDEAEIQAIVYDELNRAKRELEAIGKTV